MMKAVAMKNFPHRALFEGEDVRVLLEALGFDRERCGISIGATVCWSCSMQSKKRVEPLNTFEADVPTTAQDNLALWRARQLTSMSPDEYLEFLKTFTADVPASRETNSDSDEPFSL